MKHSTLILTTRLYATPNLSAGMPFFSLIPKYFYGPNKQDLTPLNFFGTNLLHVVSEVPDAHAAALTHTWFRITSLIGILGGFGFICCNGIYQANKGFAYQEKTGQPGSFNMTPIFIGAGVMGAGLVLHFGRHIPLHLSIAYFNRSTLETKCLYLDSYFN